MHREECVTLKVFLKNKEVTVVKKLLVDGNNASITNVSFVTELMQSAFPILLDVNFRISWRDRLGDDIPIKKDEDLVKAFTEMDGSLKTFYLVASPGCKSSDAPQVMSPPSTKSCGVCNKEITTFRYTCLQCYDYDHCIECEYSGHHSHHGVMRTSMLKLPFSKSEFQRRRDRRDLSGVSSSMENVPSFQEHASHLQVSINAGSQAVNATSDMMPHQSPKPSTQVKSTPQEEMPIYNPITNAATSQSSSNAANMANNACDPCTSAVAGIVASAPLEQPESLIQTKSASELNEEQNAIDATGAPSNVGIISEQISDLDIAIGLKGLVEMGFQDAQTLVALLKCYNGNVSDVVKHVLEN